MSIKTFMQNIKTHFEKHFEGLDELSNENIKLDLKYKPCSYLIMDAYNKCMFINREYTY